MSRDYNLRPYNNYIYMNNMIESNKKSNDTFLEKFKGKTNRIDKNGINFVLDPLAAQKQAFKVRQHILNKRKNPQSSNYHQEVDLSLQQRSFRLDKNVQKVRQSKYLDPITPKAPINVKLPSLKMDILPPIMLPNKMSNNNKNTMISFNEGSHPPSRSVSDKPDNKNPRIFGKYLKLDEQAMKHFEFLLQIDKKRQMRKNSAFLSER